MRSRTRWRSRLFTRLRVTAGPTDRATTKPIRRSCSPSTRARWTTRRGPPARRPRRTAVANPAASVRRWPRGSTPNRLIRRLRRPGGCDPCAGARRGCCARHGCASAVGSRASCDDAGCSAGTYACSRGLRSWSGQAQRLSVRRIGACPPGSSSRSTPVRPHNGTRSPSRGSNSATVFHRCPTGHRDTPGEPSTSDTPTGLEPVDNQLIHRCESCYVSGHRVVARLSHSGSGPIR